MPRVRRALRWPRLCHVIAPCCPIVVNCSADGESVRLRKFPAMSSDTAEVRDGTCFAEVTPEPLDLNKYVEMVADDGAGAIATFSGVTRNSFQGKRTEKLEYEAYVPMAARKLLVSACRAWWRQAGSGGSASAASLSAHCPPFSPWPRHAHDCPVRVGAVPSGVRALDAVQGGDSAPHRDGACGGGQRGDCVFVGAPPGSTGGASMRGVRSKREGCVRAVCANARQACVCVAVGQHRSEASEVQRLETWKRGQTGGRGFGNVTRQQQQAAWAAVHTAPAVRCSACRVAAPARSIPSPLLTCCCAVRCPPLPGLPLGHRRIEGDGAHLEEGVL